MFYAFVFLRSTEEEVELGWFS